MLYISNPQLDRPRLRAIGVPEALRGARSTGTWKPINHGLLADTVVAKAEALGLEVAEESYELNASGTDLFGSVDFCAGADSNLPDGMGLSVGLRHSNAGRYAVTLGVGARVFVCSNGMFFSDILLTRKHTVGLDLDAMVERGMREFLDESTGLGTLVGQLQALEIGTRDADHLILEAGRRGLMPWGQLRRVDREWRHPRHEEFAPRTAWSLFNAFTEVTKARSPRLQYRTHQQLAALFAPERLERLAA